jgi:hypothetical protein
MIRIAITADAFDAIAAALASGGVLYEGERTAHGGGYFIWLDESVVNNLRRLQGSRDEDLSAVIVRLFRDEANEQIAELFCSEEGLPE